MRFLSGVAVLAAFSRRVVVFSQGHSASRGAAEFVSLPRRGAALVRRAMGFCPARVPKYVKVDCPGSSVLILRS